MWRINTNLKENKLIRQRLADTGQRETPPMCIMQISYPCIVFSFHSQQIHKIRNGIRYHSQAFVKHISKDSKTFRKHS